MQPNEQQSATAPTTGQSAGLVPGAPVASAAHTAFATPGTHSIANGTKKVSGASPTKKTATNSTQNSLLISEIRDNLVIINDGSLRAVITCQSINFDLMSAKERESVEYAYQNFLNSLYFPAQILIRSQKVDIGPYLDRLSKMRREQDNMLLGVLMDDYIDFIDSLAQETNIMDKNFYIVVPYYPMGDLSSAVHSSRNLLANLFAPASQQHIRIDESSYSKSKDELRNRVQTVINGLLQLGIRSLQLTTKELGELYYNVYNPDTAVREPIGDLRDISAAVTKKGQGNAPQPQLDQEMT
jgi:hypothetical protein